MSTQSYRPYTLNTDPIVHFWATYVHGHTPHPWPAVPLCLILVVGMASLQNGLVNAATSSHHTDHSSVGRGDDLFGARRQLHSRLLCLRAVGDDCGIVSGGSCQLASVTRLLLQTTHDGALRHGAHREHVADVELGCKIKVMSSPLLAKTKTSLLLQLSGNSPGRLAKQVSPSEDCSLNVPAWTQAVNRQAPQVPPHQDLSPRRGAHPFCRSTQTGRCGYPQQR